MDNSMDSFEEINYLLKLEKELQKQIERIKELEDLLNESKYSNEKMKHQLSDLVDLVSSYLETVQVGREDKMETTKFGENKSCKSCKVSGAI